MRLGDVGELQQEEATFVPGDVIGVGACLRLGGPGHLATLCLSVSEALRVDLQVAQHACQQSRADFLAAILDDGEAAAEVERAMRAFSAAVIEATVEAVEIGRSSCRERVVSTCKSRW